MGPTLAAIDTAAATIIAAVGGAVVTGCFGAAFLLLRRRTEREALNATVVESAAQLMGEYRTQHEDDVTEATRLRDEVKGLRRELNAAEARADDAEQELRARDAAERLTGQLIDRLQREIAELKGRAND